MRQAIRYGTRDAELSTRIMCVLFQMEFGISPEDTMKMDRETREIYAGILQEWNEVKAELVASKLAKAFVGKR